jgi:hypothetical protein
MEGKLTTKNGLLYRDGEMVDLPEADNVARANGFLYVERLVKHLEESGEKIAEKSEKAER